MVHTIGRTAVAQVQSLLRGFLQEGSCPFSTVLTVKDIVDLICQECVETADRIFTPVVTLWTFLSQIHSDDPSCRAAVARLNATRVAQGLAPCSPLTGGYCKARQRLPETLLSRLVPMSGQRLQQQTPLAWHWHGRAVKIVDGSGVSMPDTEANQQAYPQPGSQKPGLGFPVARLVVVLSLACGAVLAAAVGPIKGKQTSETMLFHGLHEHLERDDVVLADRFYCSYWEIALLRGRGIDIVMRLHQRRPVDFRGGRRVGREDHILSWTKPKRPAWMDEATYAVLPATVDIRVLRVCVPQRGFRTRVVLVATTLLDAQVYPKEDLAGLSRARWHAELDLRSLKQTMQMEVLRCKTPAMVRKEIWGHLLVYNLLRAAMAQAALGHGVVPRQVSLQGTRQTLAAFHSLLAQRPSTARERVVSMVLSAIASHRVGTRPDRYEPRACKRRPKPYPLLRVPRQHARARLATAA
jgi:Transposase DDE domain